MMDPAPRFLINKLIKAAACTPRGGSTQVKRQDPPRSMDIAVVLPALGHTPRASLGDLHTLESGYKKSLATAEGLDF